MSFTDKIFNKVHNIPESWIGNNFPECACIYYTNNLYMMVEVNTFSYIGSLKVISLSYISKEELFKNFDSNSTCYAILYDHVIYDDSHYKKE